MAYIEQIRNIGRLHEADKMSGYVGIVYYQPGDWPSEQLIAKCSEYCRVFPFVKFFSVDIRVSGLSAGGVHMAFIPTIIFYRNGQMRSSFVGTDYAGVERALTAMRVDGPAIATSIHVSHRHMNLSTRK